MVYTVSKTFIDTEYRNIISQLIGCKIYGENFDENNTSHIAIGAFLLGINRERESRGLENE